MARSKVLAGKIKKEMILRNIQEIKWAWLGD